MKADKEPKEPNACPAIHPRPTDIMSVDPLELKKYYDFEKKDNPQEHIWYFPDLKMQIITSLPEELLPRPRLVCHQQLNLVHCTC